MRNPNVIILTIIVSIACITILTIISIDFITGCTKLDCSYIDEEDGCIFSTIGTNYTCKYFVSCPINKTIPCYVSTIQLCNGNYICPTTDRCSGIPTSTNIIIICVFSSLIIICCVLIIYYYRQASKMFYS
jgi:hypothetical protein